MRLRDKLKPLYLHYYLPMATKLDWVVTWLERFLLIKLYDTLMTCLARPRDKLKTFYFLRNNSYNFLIGRNLGTIQFVCRNKNIYHIYYEHFTKYSKSHQKKAKVWKIIWYNFTDMLVKKSCIKWLNEVSILAQIYKEDLEKCISKFSRRPKQV